MMQWHIKGACNSIAEEVTDGKQGAGAQGS
jgi:hypothetical protein